MMRTAAAVCGAVGSPGRVEPGEVADFIAVSANPPKDVARLHRPALVVKDGRVAVDGRRG
jgi:imidazolonepropionase-like amidohydrolase